jgi:hypothetical protein
VGVDDANNLWLLNAANQVGVLRPGDAKPTWATGVGQAGLGYEGTAVCGGAANQAYVTYWAPDPTEPYRDPPWTLDEPSPGDVDVVQLNPDGGVSLTRHLSVFNSNDHHYNHVQGVYTCVKVMRGDQRGDVYTGSNHAITRFRGLDYSDHRHPVWENEKGSLMIGYHHAVGIAQNGDVLIGNDWKVAILTPPSDLQGWIDYTRNPWKLDTYVPQIGPQSQFAFWRGVAQTTDQTYYFASLDYGLWSLPKDYQGISTTAFTKVTGLPTDSLGQLMATDDGSLYIATQGNGLWRLGADKSLGQVKEVPGSTVLQLVYDPTFTPSTLYVVTNAGLFVLRGP